MKEYLKKEYKPILIGILAYCILFAANELYGYMLIQTGIIKIDPSNGSQNLHPLLIFSTIISTLLLVMPGFLAGMYSNQKGAINGIVVISTCCIIRFFVFSVNHVDLTFDFYLFFILIQQLAMPVTIGAVSGSAGQFQVIKRAGL